MWFLIIIGTIFWNVTKTNSSNLRELTLLQTRDAKYRQRYFVNYQSNIVYV